MASKVEICNRALLLLGQAAIMSVDDNSPRARMCFQEFDSALEATLRAYPWPFATKRALLARTQEKPAFGYSYYYQLPVDCVRIIGLYTGSGKFSVAYGTQAAEVPVYQIEGDKVATDSDAMSIRYVSRDVDVEKLDPITVRVLSLNLAASLAIPIVENPDLKQMLIAEHNSAMAQARNTWAVEEFPQIPVEGPWLERR